MLIHLISVRLMDGSPTMSVRVMSVRLMVSLLTMSVRLMDGSPTMSVCLMTMTPNVGGPPFLTQTCPTRSGRGNMPCRVREGKHVLQG